MTLLTTGGRQTAEAVEDLETWLGTLVGCPAVTRTVIARCTRPAHGGEPATWFYVEADAREGVARLRCLGCGEVRPVLDSAERWSYPPAWSCQTCSQPIAEVVYGVHDDDGLATWLAVGVRCVECGHPEGVTDLVVPDVAVEVFTSSL